MAVCLAMYATIVICQTTCYVLYDIPIENSLHIERVAILQTVAQYSLITEEVEGSLKNDQDVLVHYLMSMLIANCCVFNIVLPNQSRDYLISERGFC